MFDGYGAKLGDTDAFTGGSEATRDAMGFQGQFGAYTDNETGLVLMGHRYYDAGTGRFLTRDPLGYGGGINLYGFTGNNPVNEMDPEGTQSDNSDPSDATANQLSLHGRVKIFNAQPQFQKGSQQRRDTSNFLGMTPLGGAMAVHQAVTGRDVIAGTQLSPLQRAFAIGASTLAIIGVHINREEEATIAYSSRGLAKAAKALENGATEVTVASREEVEELFLRHYQGDGYRNTTGMNGNQVRNDHFLFPNGKRGTYHWDLADTKHGGRLHLNVHTHSGPIVRIFFH